MSLRRNWVARLAQDEAGASAIMIAFSLMALVAMSSLAIDLAYLYSTRTQLQSTADAAALAGAARLPDETAARTEAVAYAFKNMNAAVHGAVLSGSDVLIGAWDATTRTFTPGGDPKNAIQVLTRRTASARNAVRTFFAQLLGINAVDVAASSIATTEGGPFGCIIALNPTIDRAFFVQGNAAIHTYDCDVQVNSCHASEALRAQGNVDILIEDMSDPANYVGKIRVCGGVSTTGPASLQPTPETGPDKQVSDPFESVDGPSPGLYDDASDCDHTNFSATGSVDLFPGVYCGGIRLSGNGTATFNAAGGTLSDGLYIIKDGEFQVTGNVDVVGNGVTFFLTGSESNIDFGGTADVGLSAATTGPLKGFVFFGDRNDPATAHAHEIRGTALGGYEGFVYLPGSVAEFQGTATGTIGAVTCALFVADTFYFHGTPNLEARRDCAAFGMPMTTIGKLVQ